MDRVALMEQAIASNIFPLAEVLTEKSIQILASGLMSLEGALKALQQPLPEGLDELKEALSRQREVLALSSSAYLATQQVALLLNCSPRRVRQLGQQGYIKLVRQGGRGRGRSNVYDAASVYTYLDSMVSGVAKIGE